MKTIKLLFVFLSFMGFEKINAQVMLDIKKPLSDADRAEVENILKDFDPSTYSFVGGTNARSYKYGSAKGLADVKQSNSRILLDAKGNAASTNVQYNIFKNLKASTNVQYNVFKTKAGTNVQYNIFKELGASTNVKYNVFKPTDAQLTKMDALYNILAKYQ